MYGFRYDSPIGMLCIIADDKAIHGIYLETKDEQKFPLLQLHKVVECRTPLIDTAITQLSQYFQGERKEFSLPLCPQGTAFQKRTWNALLAIPYGQTRSYGDIAKAIGCDKGCRAVGLANNRNPIIIVIPCHRVIGSNGKLVGYGGGLEVKEQLLRLEGVSFDACSQAARR